VSLCTCLALTPGLTSGEGLAAALAAAPDKGRREALEGLVYLGSGGLPEVFSLITGEGLDELLALPQGLAVEADELDELGLEALGGLPHSKVLGFLGQVGGAEATAPERAAVLRSLGRLGSLEGLPLFVDQLEALGPAARAGAPPGPLAVEPEPTDPPRLDRGQRIGRRGAAHEHDCAREGRERTDHDAASAATPMRSSSSAPSKRRSVPCSTSLLCSYSSASNQTARARVSSPDIHRASPR